jgi:hypothetical protein
MKIDKKIYTDISHVFHVISKTIIRHGFSNTNNHYLNYRYKGNKKGFGLDVRKR